MLKLGHRLNAIPVKILTDFCEIGKVIIKCVELQRSRNYPDF